MKPTHLSLGYWIRLAAINFAVTMILLAGALAGVEGYLRATIPASSGESLFESTQTTRRYKVMKPNARIVAWGSEFRTNSLGFRDRQSGEPTRSASAFRVVVLGDSFTASAGVDFDEIYTSLVEKAIRRQVPDAEVINLAVGGYNIIQEAMVLEEVGLSLHPDHVVAAVFPFNDLSNDTYRVNEAEARGHSRTTSPSAWYEELYVYRAYLGRIEGRIRSWFDMAASAPSSVAAAPDNTIDRDREENLAALEQIVNRAAKAGLGVTVVLLPNTDMLEQQRAAFAPFEARCREHQWACLNLLDGFMAKGVRPHTLRLNQLDPHPNKRYNALVAEFLAEFLTPIARGSRRPPPDPGSVQ